MCGLTNRQYIEALASPTAAVGGRTIDGFGGIFVKLSTLLTCTFGTATASSLNLTLGTVFFQLELVDAAVESSFQHSIRRPIIHMG